MLLGRKKPGMLSVNLTDRCNQHCIYCEIGRHNGLPGDDRLNLNDLKWIIDQMAREKIRRLSLCGGEPFLFKELIQVVDYAGNNSIHCTITSNGMTIHELGREEFAILRKHNTFINISIDSFREEIQNKTRGHKKALSNALLSMEKVEQEGIPLTVLTVISKWNYEGLYPFILEAHRRNIRQVLFQPVIHASNYPGVDALSNKHRLNIPPEKVETLLDELKKILHFEHRHRISTNVYRILPWIASYIRAAGSDHGAGFWTEVLGKFYCREIYAIIDITYNGEIQACGLVSSGVSIKQHNEESLLSKWNRATLPLRKDLENNRFLPVCNACCHHFSRNMLASVMRYPFRNRKMLFYLTQALLMRIISRAMLKH